MGPLSDIPEFEPELRSTVVEIPINDNVSIIFKEPKDQEHIEEPPPPPPVENTNFYTANFVKCFILLLVTGSTSTLLAK